MRAVVHADHGDGLTILQVTSTEKCGESTHIAFRVLRLAGKICGDIRQVFTLSVHKAVALFGDSEAHHLQRGILENLFQALFTTVEVDFLSNGTDDSFLHLAVRAKRYLDGEIVVRFRLFLPAFRSNNTGFDDSGIQKPLTGIRLKGFEDVAGTEVYPGGIGFCRFHHSGTVKCGKTIAFCFPFSFVLQSLFSQNHFFVSFSIESQTPSIYIMPRARSYSP